MLDLELWLKLIVLYKHYLLCFQKRKQRRESTFWDRYGGNGEARGLFMSNFMGVRSSKGKCIKKEIIYTCYILEGTSINTLVT